MWGKLQSLQKSNWDNQKKIPNLTTKIPNTQGGSEKYLENCNNIMNGAAVVDELRDAFFTVKTNKSPGHDYIFFKAINFFFTLQ